MKVEEKLKRASASARNRVPPPLQRASYVPLYYQLVAVLEERIAAGKLKPGATFFSESKLCQEFDVSRSVVRPALDVLEREGRIMRIKGRGCFVAAPKVGLAACGLVRRL